MNVGAVKAPTVQRGCPLRTITTIGLDIAKSVFQVQGVDAGGEVVVRRQLKRRYVMAFFQKLPACLVGIEACASGLQFGEEQLRHSSIPSEMIFIIPSAILPQHSGMFHPSRRAKQFSPRTKSFRQPANTA